MKRIAQLAILFIFMFSMSNLNAQIKDKLSLTVNLARISPIPGIFAPFYSPRIRLYPYKSYFVNGLELGYKLSNKREAIVGIKRVNTFVNFGGGHTREFFNVNGFELHTGLEFSSSKTKRVFLSFVGEFFMEYSWYEGFYASDGPPCRCEINHLRFFAGLAPGIKINIRIRENILIQVGSRIKAGAVSFRGLTQSQAGEILYPNLTFFNYSLDPLNILGIKIRL